jgi:hypothetical protein
MSTFQERIANERRHLLDGPAPDEKPGGLGTVRFLGWCSGSAEQIIERAKAVLTVVNQHSAGEWPTDQTWRELLPAWFVARCGPELSQEEAEAEMARRKKLPPEEQKRAAEEGWSLLNWIYWFQPENRYWYWWDAKPLDDKVLVVVVEAHEWPFPSGALAWLLRAAGAERVEAEQ